MLSKVGGIWRTGSLPVRLVPSPAQLLRKCRSVPSPQRGTLTDPHGRRPGRPPEPGNPPEGHSKGGRGAGEENPRGAAWAGSPFLSLPTRVPSARRRVGEGAAQKMPEATQVLLWLLKSWASAKPWGEGQESQSPAVASLWERVSTEGARRGLSDGSRLGPRLRGVSPRAAADTRHGKSFVFCKRSSPAHG